MSSRNSGVVADNVSDVVRLRRKLNRTLQALMIGIEFLGRMDRLAAQSDVSGFISLMIKEGKFVSTSGGDHARTLYPIGTQAAKLVKSKFDRLETSIFC